MVTIVGCFEFAIIIISNIIRIVLNFIVEVIKFNFNLEHFYCCFRIIRELGFIKFIIGFADISFGRLALSITYRSKINHVLICCLWNQFNLDLIHAANDLKLVWILIFIILNYLPEFVD